MSSGLRAVAKTRQPSAFKARAQCAPMPDDAPVTTIVRNSFVPLAVFERLAIYGNAFPYSRPGNNRVKTMTPLGTPAAPDRTDTSACARS
jgi:hypothetical protein